jgi:hypothetical protein
MRDVSLAELTRWKIGGIAPAFARARSESELRALLSEVEGQPVRVLGKGANLLIADEGPGGPVLVLDGDFKDFELLKDTIRCGAAAPISSVVQAARRGAREGLWILEAVPGSMGGALRMNAGSAERGLWTCARGIARSISIQRRSSSGPRSLRPPATPSASSVNTASAGRPSSRRRSTICRPAARHGGIPLPRRRRHGSS